MKAIFDKVLRNISVIVFILVMFYAVIVLRRLLAIPKMPDFESKIGVCVLLWLLWNIPVLFIMAWERSKTKKYWLTNILNSFGMIMIPYLTIVLPAENKLTGLYQAIENVTDILRGYVLSIERIWVPGRYIVICIGAAILGGALIARIAVIFVILLNILSFSRSNVYGTFVLKFPVINMISCALFELGYLWLSSKGATMHIFLVPVILESIIFICGVSQSSEGLFGMKKDILSVDVIVNGIKKKVRSVRNLFLKETYDKEYFVVNGMNILLFCFSVAGLVYLFATGRVSLYSYALSASLGMRANENLTMNPGFASAVSLLQFIIPVFVASVVGTITKESDNVKTSPFGVAVFSYVAELFCFNIISQKVYGVLPENVLLKIDELTTLDDTKLIILLIVFVVVLVAAIILMVRLVGTLISGLFCISFQLVDYLVMITYFIIAYFFVREFNADLAMYFVNPLTIVLLNYILSKIIANYSRKIE